MKITLANGDIFELPFVKTFNKTKVVEDDKVKIHGHYILEVGVTFLLLNIYEKNPDRPRFLAILKLIMAQLRGRNTSAKYPLEILIYLMQQYSLLGEQQACKVFHDNFVNLKGKADCNIPADLFMETLIKKDKQVIRHMASNKDPSSILKKSSCLAGMSLISQNFDEDTDVIIRSKKHQKPNLNPDVLHMIEDLRILRPFNPTPGRAFNNPKFNKLKHSPAYQLNNFSFIQWFERHKREMES